MCHEPSVAHIDAIASGTAYRKGPLDPQVQFDRLNNRDFVSMCAQCHMQSNVHAASPNGEMNYSSTGTLFLRNASLPFGDFSRKGFFKDCRFSRSSGIVDALRVVPQGNGHLRNLPRSPQRYGAIPHNFAQTSRLSRSHVRRLPYATGGQSCCCCTHHPIESVASRCVSCHMPRIMDGLLFRARSHQIDDVPNAENTIRFGQNDSPNACMLCHTDKTAEWVRSQLKTWKSGTLVNAQNDAARNRPATGSR
jgi:hypothetical protein